MIRTIIIDDEPSAVNVLSLLLKKKCKADIQIIATSNSPHLGKLLIDEHDPDLVFLDIEMPGMTGIDLVRSYSGPRFKVVFTTAFDAYAVEAFRLNAIDYLLKPVESEDIEKLIMKVKREIVSTEDFKVQANNLQKLFAETHSITETKIGIGMADKIVFVNIADILYCEAQAAYTYIYLIDGSKVVASKSLGEFEALLLYKCFFRIHHSYLINLNKIKEFQRAEGGYVLMENKVKLEVSQRKRKDFLSAIDSHFI